MDPDAKVTISEDPVGEGATYAWEGGKTGAGVMLITESTPERIDLDLDFIKPFKAENKVVFTFLPIHGGTQVTWTMTGENSFIGKAMCLFMTMDKMVGGDFEKGLKDIKRQSEIASGWIRELPSLRMRWGTPPPARRIAFPPPRPLQLPQHSQIIMNPHHQIPELAIEAESLVKHYGKTRAVDGVDLRVRAGSVYGMLGPNGAGKTTTVRMLATLINPDAGRATVLGHDLLREGAALRRRISLTGQFASVDEDLTGRENLMLLAKLLGFRGGEVKRRSDALLEAFDLTDAAGQQAKTYSGGMRRRLDIASSLVIVPDLLFLDEPTTGLDPRSRNQVWDIVRSLTAQGTTVLLTTQYLEEADQLAARIAVVDHGKVIAEGTSAELKASVGSGVLHVRLRHPEDRGKAAAALATRFGSEPHLASDPAALSIPCPDA